ncbi:MAG: YdcF family protein [Erysipelotrichaceae bacterium]|nr:YdcF family protein [Erysipelotrichaceae bacterium]
MEFTVGIGISLFFWFLFYVCFSRDRSRYRNSYLPFLALSSTLLALLLSTDSYINGVVVMLLLLIFLAILIVPFFLIHNGIVMIKNEGHSLPNLLSLFFGITIGLGEIATFLVVAMAVMSDTKDEQILSFIKVAGTPLIFVSVSVIYLSVSFLIFMLYTLFLQIIPKKKDFDYVIIHGSGLLDGNRVSKLLSDRIDKALDIYHKDPTPPILIPSGGKGADETVSEASAMADYIKGKDIPEDKIIIEDESKTTYENLLNSKKIIDAKEGNKYTALVTSNYHVYRALRHARKVGLKCTGIGSHVAFYYWPSALIREYIAVHAEKKHLFILILGWLICLAPFVYGLLI